MCTLTFYPRILNGSRKVSYKYGKFGRTKIISKMRPNQVNCICNGKKMEYKNGLIGDSNKTGTKMNDDEKYKSTSFTCATCIKCMSTLVRYLIFENPMDKTLLNGRRFDSAIVYRNFSSSSNENPPQKEKRDQVIYCNEGKSYGNITSIYSINNNKTLTQKEKTNPNVLCSKVQNQHFGKIPSMYPLPDEYSPPRDKNIFETGKEAKVAQSMETAVGASEQKEHMSPVHDLSTRALFNLHSPKEEPKEDESREQEEGAKCLPPLGPPPILRPPPAPMPPLPSCPRPRPKGK